MTDTLHPREHLSAYLDGALTPAERAAVDTHLDTCPDCRARVAELRGVATLLRSLPGPVPSRRLVPRLATAPLWMAPLRTLATLASGVSVFLFMASAILANIGFLAGGSASTAASGAAVAPQAAPAASVTSQDRAAASAGPTSDAKAAATAPGAFAATTPAPTPVPPTNAYAAQAPEHSVPGIAVGPSPWVWLVLAVVTGIIALALQRRLRSI